MFSSQTGIGTSPVSVKQIHAFSGIAGVGGWGCGLYVSAGLTIIAGVRLCTAGFRARAVVTPGGSVFEPTDRGISMPSFFKHRIRDPLVRCFSYLQPSFFTHRLIQGATGFQVHSGPFSGMKYLSASVGSQYYPKILGTYEKELHPTIEDLCSRNFDHVVNVGAGEGFYAVGLALRMPGVGVIAFEADEAGQQFTRRMAQVNGVQTRVIVHGLCDIPAFASCFRRSRNCLVFMDAEGAEALLLDPQVIPELSEVHILVELHDFIFRQIGDLITSRFETSHRITEIISEPRAVADYPFPISSFRVALLKKYLLRAISEDRPGRMRWFLLEPHVASRHSD